MNGAHVDSSSGPERGYSCPQQRSDRLPRWGCLAAFWSSGVAADRNVRAPSTRGAFTLVEIMIAVGASAMLLAAVMSLYIFGLRSFGAIGNYSEMDSRSRQALDLMLKEIREASKVVGFQTNGPTPWLSVAYTNAPAVTNTFVWDSTTNGFTWAKTGQPTKTLLTGCTAWNFACYLRAPVTNGVFVQTTNGARTKLINMSWSCSRTNVFRVNTESIVTAEVVLRNLQE